MTIAVVIPLFNKKQYIGRAIRSVLAQSDPQFELVVVNDGSTDGSEGEVNALTDSRLRLITQTNAGEACARNRGIDDSRAPLLAFLDADDEWLPDQLATLRRLASSYPECGAYGTALQGRNYPDIAQGEWEGVLANYFRAALGTWPLTSSTAAVWRSVFQEVGQFAAGERLGADIDMWARIALKYRIAFSTRPGAVYHNDDEGRVTQQESKVAPSFHRPVIRTLTQHGDRGAPELGFSGRDLRNYRLKYLYGEVLGPNIIRGDRGRAMSQLVRTWPTSPYLKVYFTLMLIGLLPRRVYASLHRLRHGNS